MNTRYTPADDAVIIKEIKNNPHNLEQAFKKASLVLERTAGAVGQRYYSVVRNTVPMLGVGNDEKFLVNTKNTISTLDNSFFNAKMRDNLITTALHGLPKEAIIQFFMDDLSAEDKKRVISKILRHLRR